MTLLRSCGSYGGREEEIILPSKTALTITLGMTLLRSCGSYGGREEEIILPSKTALTITLGMKGFDSVINGVCLPRSGIVLFPVTQRYNLYLPICQIAPRAW